MVHSSEFVIRFGEIDQAGIVYYPRFFNYYHQTFEDWFEYELGVSYAKVLKEERMGFPIVKIHSEFFKPLHFGDKIVNHEPGSGVSGPRAFVRVHNDGAVVCQLICRARRAFEHNVQPGS